MVFERTIKLFTRLSVKDIRSNLESITHDFDTIDGEKVFQGKILNDSFSMYPLFNSGTRAQLKPKIGGKVHQKENFRLIIVRFTLPLHTKRLIKLVLMINVSVFFILLLSTFLFPAFIKHVIWSSKGIAGIYLGAIVVSIISFTAGFNIKVRKAINLLKINLSAIKL